MSPRVPDAPPRTVKIVYEGAGMAGKTANLDAIHGSLCTPGGERLIRLATSTDRTLFFDFLALDYSGPSGRRTRTRLYTVPGQVFYNDARRILLEDVDAIVFVADSDPERFSANASSLRRLRQNLLSLGMDLARIPGVLQVNKRDVPGALPTEHLSEALNPHGWPTLEAQADRGRGVLETLAVAHDLALSANGCSSTLAAS